ncbi:hypothetical protein BZA77DRAFT_290192 [Pyronema omphalodes]|nr:hypothetical protein BZA77DRAFT_290192 [Pyronema omphalodes]
MEITEQASISAVSTGGITSSATTIEVLRQPIQGNTMDVKDYSHFSHHSENDEGGKSGEGDKIDDGDDSNLEEDDSDKKVDIHEKYDSDDVEDYSDEVEDYSDEVEDDSDEVGDDSDEVEDYSDDVEVDSDEVEDDSDDLEDDSDEEDHSNDEDHSSDYDESLSPSYVHDSSGSEDDSSDMHDVGDFETEEEFHRYLLQVRNVSHLPIDAPERFRHWHRNPRVCVMETLIKVKHAHMLCNYAASESDDSEEGSGAGCRHLPCYAHRRLYRELMSAEGATAQTLWGLGLL